VRSICIAAPDQIDQTLATLMRLWKHQSRKSIKVSVQNETSRDEARRRSFSFNQGQVRTLHNVGLSSHESRMKRIEAVIKPHLLDAFREAAPRFGITQFDVVEVHRSGSGAREGRLYRGCSHTADLLPRLRVEFVLFDEDVQTAVNGLFELVHPESVAIFRMDKTIRQTS